MIPFVHLVAFGLYNCIQTEAANSTSSANSTAGPVDNDTLLQCAKSWSSYSSASSADVTYVLVTSTSYATYTVDWTYGTADVYTSISGIPVASGSFTPTKVVQQVVTITTTYEDTEATTLNSSVITAYPSCPPPSPSQCSMLYVSYLQSLGLSPNASVPTITPVPTNSPACPTYYYQPFSSCTTFPDPIVGMATCSVFAEFGANVQVFYFPPNTAGPLITPSVVQQSMAPGITFTSPSVYLSFDALTAVSEVGGDAWACTSCGWNGCEASAVAGGVALQLIGTATSGALLALAPTDVSSLLISLPTTAVDVLAHGLPGFADDVAEVMYAGTTTSRALNLNAISHPEPTDYYFLPFGAPGCSNDYPTPECSTIFEGLYSPNLAIPSQVSLLQSAWSTCIPATYGINAMPTALTDLTTFGGAGQYPAPSTTSGPRSTDTCEDALVESSTARVAT